EPSITKIKPKLLGRNRGTSSHGCTFCHVRHFWRSTKCTFPVTGPSKPRRLPPLSRQCVLKFQQLFTWDLEYCRTGQIRFSTDGHLPVAGYAGTIGPTAPSTLVFQQLCAPREWNQNGGRTHPVIASKPVSLFVAISATLG